MENATEDRTHTGGHQNRDPARANGDPHRDPCAANHLKFLDLTPLFTTRNTTEMGNAETIEEYVGRLWGEMGIFGDVAVTELKERGTLASVLVDQGTLAGTGADIELSVSKTLLRKSAEEVREVLVHEGFHVILWRMTSTLMYAGELEGSELATNLVAGLDEAVVERLGRTFARFLPLPRSRLAFSLAESRGRRPKGTSDRRKERAER